MMLPFMKKSLCVLLWLCWWRSLLVQAFVGNINRPAVAFFPHSTFPCSFCRKGRRGLQAGNNEDADEDDDEEKQQRNNRFASWIYGSSSGDTSPLVEPILVNDDEDDDPIPLDTNSLFDGMPSLTEILSDEDSLSSSDSSTASTAPSSSSFDTNDDDSWFDKEKQEIIATYADMLEQMKEQLANEEVVPDNAHALIQTVIQQEMEKELAETKQTRIMERLQDYAQDIRNDVSTSTDNVDEERMQQLMDDTQAEYDIQQANRLELEDFLHYEQQALVRGSSTDESIPYPSQEEGDNWDQWAMDRLEDQMDKEEEEDDERVRDIIQESMDDLAAKMKEKEERSQSTLYEPESLKEWQMYRSIATKMGSGTESTNTLSQDDTKVREQLESWKGYMEKEKVFRRDSGLTTTTSRVEEATEDENDETSLAMRQQQTIDTRKTLNRMSIEALESLRDTADAARSAKLQEEIDFLKAALEGNDYLDVDESMLLSMDEATSPAGPIENANELFRPYTPDEADDVEEDEQFYINPPPPPVDFEETARVSDYSYDEDESTETIENYTPDTPFFTDSTAEPPLDDTATTTLGSMEDQKLQAMYRKAGAKTTEEREALRAQWQDFQRFEEQSRIESGLTEEGDVLNMTAYNISSVMKDDGDFDADAILSSIGPRPSRTKKRKAEQAEELETTFKSGLEKEEIDDSLYRAVSAIGGGRYREDPSADAEQKALFQEFKEKEDEIRESLDDPTDLSDATDLPMDDDGVAYAEEVLSSLGPRPQPKKARKIDPKDYSDRGGILSSDDASEDDDYEDDDTPDEFALGLVPDWLRKENEEAKLGIAPKRKMFPDRETEEAVSEEDYKRNMKQLAEFERRRSRKPKPMGIDISDVLGRRDYDDYGDYRYEEDYSRARPSSWGSESFISRKRDLLEYRELEVEQVNALMDFKESVYSTGVSQYLPRINKPFREFGAVFQLEGVLIDVTGFHFKAWSIVASQFGFKEPYMDDVEKAAVTNPEIVAKEVLFWTDDLFECRRIAGAHRAAMKQVFDSWMMENGIENKKEVASGVVLGMESTTDTEHVPPSTSPSLNEADLFRKLAEAWQETATLCGKDPPRDEDVMTAASVTPDIAVMRVFQWTSSPNEVDRIVEVFRRTVKPENPIDSKPTASHEPSKTVLTKEDVMELHYKAWSMVADAFQVETPLADEVLAAFVINDPQMAVEGFGWDDSIRAQAAIMFQKHVDELLIQSGYSAKVAPAANAAVTSTSKPPPDFGQVFKQALDAWTATAEESKLEAPDEEQVLFALSVGPEDAIRYGFEWASESEQVEELVNIYLTQLGRIMKSTSSAPTFKLPKSTNVAVSSKGPSDDELFRAVSEAWTTTAEKMGYPLPEEEEIVFAMTVGGEQGILEGFQWSEDPTEIAEILDVYRAEIGKKRAQWNDPSQTIASSPKAGTDMPLFTLRDGARRWIQSLVNVEMQCGAVSYFEDYQVKILLEQAGLGDLLEQRVSATQEYPTLQNQLLGAALRLERRPDHCVLFDCTPYGSVAAHDVEMQSVSFVGAYPRYELLSADSTASSFDLLTAMNIRRLFGERIYDQPQLDTQQNQPQNVARRRTKTKYFYDDD